MKRFLRSALAVAVMMLLSMSLFALNSRAENQSESEIGALKEQIEQIQRQNQQQIEELRKKIDELEAKKEIKEPEKEKFLSNFDAGYKDGLFLKTRDDKFSLRFNTLFQFQFFVTDFDNDRKSNPDPQVSFQIRRLRLLFSGNGFFPWLKYYIQLDADRATSFNLRDAYIDFGYFSEATPRIGQYKISFNREELTSDYALEFVDRSIVNDEFTLERDIGAEIYGSLFNHIIEYAGGIFNGSGRNVAQNLDNNFLYVGRVVFTPFGEYKYSQADLEDSNKPLLAIGAAVAGLNDFNPLTEGGASINGSTGAVSFNSSNRANLARAVLAIDKTITSADIVQFTADVAFKYMGFALEGEYDLRHISPNVGRSATGQGLRVQAGYLLVPPHLEVAFRYGIVDPNNHQSDDRRQEFTPALVYYVFGHRLKFTADYSLLLGQNPGTKSFKDNRFRIQTQFYF